MVKSAATIYKDLCQSSAKLQSESGKDALSMVWHLLVEPIGERAVLHSSKEN